MRKNEYVECKKAEPRDGPQANKMNSHGAMMSMSAGMSPHVAGHLSGPMAGPGLGPPPMGPMANGMPLGAGYQPGGWGGPQQGQEKFDDHIHWCDHLVRRDQNILVNPNEDFISGLQHPCQSKPQLSSALIPKKYAKCEHIEYLPCHIDIEQMKCKIPIHRKLKCGHEITSDCWKFSEGEPKCKMLVTYKFQNCGHVTKVQCSADVVDLKCLKNCDYRLKCGHSCPKKCHIDDEIQHEEILCEKNCQKVICRRGHKCPLKCCAKCPDCIQAVNKTLPCGHTILHPCFEDSYSSCNKIFEKELDCGHIIKAACGIPKVMLRCDQICEKKLSCGHKCQNNCKDSCTIYCTQPVILERSCGHEVVVSCHEQNAQSIIESDDCNEPCNELLPCLHKCTGTCGQCRQGRLCYSSCNKIVEKELDCGHIIKAACGIPKVMLRCDQICEEKLSCGHKCQNNCKDSCTIYCTQPVILERSCGHEVVVSCHEQNAQSIIESDDCNEPCNELLPCLHKCTGTCGQCRQGRLHIPCQNPCNKLLVCGHFCNYKCSPTCPPCNQQCAAKCGHSKCRRLCYEECENCIEECEWKCEHFSCQRLCHKICNRPRCNEPCTKTLHCGHQCIGLCGEECPNLCRICNWNDLTEFILSGNEDEKDARFIELVDCGHCIEVNALDSWMDAESAEIKMKQCPRCKTTIWTSNRYENVIKKHFAIIVEVTNKTYGNIDELKKKSDELGKLIERNVDISQQFRNEIQYLLERLYSNLSADQLALIENQFNVLLTVTTWKIKFDRMLRNQTAKDYFTTQTKQLVDRLMKENEVVNENTMADIYKELTRIKFQTMIREDVCKLATKSCHPMVKRILSNSSKLSDKDERRVETYLHEMFRHVPHYALEICEEERAMIVKAIGMKPGHWYKCPNGHIYVITECGGADERGNCSECGVSIGGENHSLDESNLHAGEMDDSLHPAWSNQTGLGNYALND